MDKKSKDFKLAAKESVIINALKKYDKRRQKSNVVVDTDEMVCLIEAVEAPQNVSFKFSNNLIRFLFLIFWFFYDY